MSSEKICGTPLTIDGLTKSLQKYFETPAAKLEKVTGKQIAVGEGFTSKIYRLDLTWSNNESSKTLPKTIILKAPSVESIEYVMEKFSGEQQNIETMVKMIKQVGNTEITAYNLLRPLNVVPMPVCYGSENFIDVSSTGYLLLEDMSPKSAIVPRQTTGAPLSLEQVTNVVETVANFHAWCICTDVPLSEHFGRMEDHRDTWSAALKSFMDGVPGMKKKFPDEFRDVNEDAVATYFNFDKYMELHNRFNRIMPPILVHGDFWANNVMFKLNPSDGQITNDVYGIIDWQTCHLGNCMYDFGRLFSFFPKEFLDAHIDNLLKQYYNVLKSKCGGKFTASFQQIKTLFDEQFAINALQFFSMANVALAIQTEDVDVFTQYVLKLAQDNYKMAAKTLKL